MKLISASNLTAQMCSLFLILGGVFPLAAAPLKVATVDMQKLLIEFHETKAAEAEDRVEREDIKEDDDERIAAINGMEEEMRKLRGEFQDPSLSDSKRKAIAAQFAEREQTLVALRRERQEFIQRRTRALNQKMVDRMKEIRDKISKQIETHSASLDVDYVFDSSGLTTSQVPFILYIRNKVDITEDVLKLLNKDQPAPPENKESSTATDAPADQ